MKEQVPSPAARTVAVIGFGAQLDAVIRDDPE